MVFTTSKKSITLEVSLPDDIIDYINSLVSELESLPKENRKDSTLETLFTTIIENLYLNRYRKLLTGIYLGKLFKTY